jgi:hypothetical protein
MWEMIRAQIQANLLFSERSSKAIFTRVLAAETWGFDDAVSKDWIATTATRFRCHGSHINNAWQKNPKTKWLQQFSWVAATPTTEDCEGERSSIVPLAAAAPPPPPRSGRLWYGFDAEHEKAFKAYHDGTGYELGEIAEGSASYDAAHGVWPNEKVALPDLTVGDWQAMLANRRARGSRQSACEHWAGEHDKSKSKLLIKDRADRFPLVSSYEDGAQILQMREDSLATKEDVVNAMKTIALLYKSGAIDKLGLKAARDKLVSEKKGDRKAGEKVSLASILTPDTFIQPEVPFADAGRL